MSRRSTSGYAPAATLQCLHSSGRSSLSSPAEQHTRNCKKKWPVHFFWVCKRFQVFWGFILNFQNSSSFYFCLRGARRKPRQELYQFSVKLTWLSNHLVSFHLSRQGLDRSSCALNTACSSCQDKSLFFTHALVRIHFWAPKAWSVTKSESWNDGWGVGLLWMEATHTHRQRPGIPGG